jgi:hypothetical protein
MTGKFYQIPAEILEGDGNTIPTYLSEVLSEASKETLQPFRIYDILGAYVADPLSAGLVIEERMEWEVTHNAALDRIRILGREFLVRFLRNIRDVICKQQNEKALQEKLGAAAPSALVPSILLEFGVDKPVALGIAAAITYAVLTATKGAFCSMTDQEVLRKIDKA